MTKIQFPLGTLVKMRDDDLGNGKMGVVVPDSFSCCGEREVLVEWDGESERGVLSQLLEAVGVVQLPVDQKGCSNCVYSTGITCLRYLPGRIGMLFSAGVQNKRIPNRIPPRCQSQ